MSAGSAGDWPAAHRVGGRGEVLHKVVRHVERRGRVVLELQKPVGELLLRGGGREGQRCQRRVLHARAPASGMLALPGATRMRHVQWRTGPCMARTSSCCALMRCASSATTSRSVSGSSTSADIGLASSGAGAGAAAAASARSHSAWPHSASSSALQHIFEHPLSARLEAAPAGARAAPCACPQKLPLPPPAASPMFTAEQARERARVF